jgi:N-acetylmuramoyl-L-alanine amidase
LKERNATRRAPGALVLLATLGACVPAGTGPAPGGAPAAEPAPLRYQPVSPALPPIPEIDGALAIRVVHPTPTTTRPRVDSTFIYGSVGTGRAALAINGTPVPVAANGAFLAYLPVPQDGRYELEASAGGQRTNAVAAYAAPPAAPAESAPAARETFAQPRAATVTGGADTLATGSDAAVGRPTPTGAYRWFLPRGARLVVHERRGDMVRAQLDSATAAWLPASAVTLGEPAAPQPAAVPAAALTVAPAAGWVDLRFAAGGAPFQLQPEANRIVVTLYGRSAPAGAPPRGDSLVSGITWLPEGSGRAAAEVRLMQPLWGYKAFYTPEGDLVVRVRRPPAIDPAQPLRGVRVAVDPGHPPAGATGPTGLTEAEANLAIGTRLAERLRARGAEVLMTRTGNTAVGLAERTQMAAAGDAHLLVSVHNNAFGEGTNPFRGHGTSTYYFHPFSAALARELDREIVGVTQIPDLGARQGNLALVRPTWMPSTLTESLFMLIPEQEAALRNPEFLDRLADAHVRGIEAFLRGRAAGAPAR